MNSFMKCAETSLFHSCFTTQVSWHISKLTNKLVFIFPTDFILRINKRKLTKHDAEKSNPTRYKVSQRTQLVGYRIQSLNPPLDPKPPSRPVNASNRPIIIQYGHPVSTKKLKKSYPRADEKKEAQQNVENLRSFNQRIVVVKGRLKKPITNLSRRDYHQNFHTMIL